MNTAVTCYLRLYYLSYMMATLCVCNQSKPMRSTDLEDKTKWLKDWFTQITPKSSGTQADSFDFICPSFKIFHRSIYVLKYFF